MQGYQKLNQKTSKHDSEYERNVDSTMQGYQKDQKLTQKSSKHDSEYERNVDSTM